MEIVLRTNMLEEQEEGQRRGVTFLRLLANLMENLKAQKDEENFHSTNLENVIAVEIRVWIRYRFHLILGLSLAASLCLCLAGLRGKKSSKSPLRARDAFVSAQSSGKFMKLSCAVCKRSRR